MKFKFKVGDVVVSAYYTYDSNKIAVISYTGLDERTGLNKVYHVDYIISGTNKVKRVCVLSSLFDEFTYKLNY